MNQAGVRLDIFDRVLRLSDVDPGAVGKLLGKYDLCLTRVEAGKAIPGSYWGEEEAGLLGNQVLVRQDTPVHSMLHEACHYVCMDEVRRRGLDTDAGGNYDEENAVCYLQILLADYIAGFGRQRMFKDMDHWGYTFRLGSANAWFEMDADDARDWLIQHELIDKQQRPSFQLRQQ